MGGRKFGIFHRAFIAISPQVNGQVRDQIEHEKRNSISKSHQLSFCLTY